MKDPQFIVQIRDGEHGEWEDTMLQSDSSYTGAHSYADQLRHVLKHPDYPGGADDVRVVQR